MIEETPLTILILRCQSNYVVEKQIINGGNIN